MTSGALGASGCLLGVSWVPPGCLLGVSWVLPGCLLGANCFDQLFRNKKLYSSLCKMYASTYYVYKRETTAGSKTEEQRFNHLSTDIVDIYDIQWRS
jgi:hypothetical protein